MKAFTSVTLRKSFAFTGSTSDLLRVKAVIALPTEHRGGTCVPFFLSLIEMNSSKSSVVDLDGRIELGDKILQVNEVNVEQMDNDDAVCVLPDVIQKPARITLIVARRSDPCPSPEGDIVTSGSEPICPVDRGAVRRVANIHRLLLLLQASNSEDHATSAPELGPRGITPERQLMPIAVRNSPSQNVQNLPLLCVEAICKFTPTSKLIRLHSVAMPLPGPNWNVGVQSVLRKRLPLSVSDVPAYHQAADPSCFSARLFDSSGAKVAAVKRPEAFRASPLCRLVESATLGVRLVSPPATFFRWNNQERYAVQGEALLSRLSNVRKLTLIDLCPISQASAAKAGRPLLSLKHLLPRLEAFAFQRSDFRPASEVLDLAVVDLMRGMPNLRALDIPLTTLDVLKRAKWLCDRTPALCHVSSLGIWQRTHGDNTAQHASILSAPFFITPRDSQISQLSIFVCGDFKAYPAAFKAMTCLRTLGLKIIGETNLIGLTFSEDQSIPSVLELRLCCPESLGALLPRIYSLFPNVTMATLQSVNGIDATLRMAIRLCEEQLLPKLTRLALANAHWSALSFETMVQFLSASSVPGMLDLSQVLFPFSSAFFLMDEALLASLFRTMQTSSAQTLLLRGPVTRSGLIRLLGHLALNAPDAKVSAWRDRDLCGLPGVAGDNEGGLQQTNFKIVGAKTSGNLKGERFTISVSHPLAKRRGIFD